MVRVVGRSTKRKQEESENRDDNSAFINKNIEDIPEAEIALIICLISVNNKDPTFKDEKIVLIPRELGKYILNKASVSISEIDILPQKPFIFDSFNVSVIPGDDKSFPATVCIVAEVKESYSFFKDDLDSFKKNLPEDSTWIEWSNEPGVTMILLRPSTKTMFDTWDWCSSYDSCINASGMSVGGPLYTFSHWPNISVSIRSSLVAQDILRFLVGRSSRDAYLECSSGFIVGLASTKNHLLEYNLTAHSLIDPSHMLCCRPGAIQQDHDSLLSSLNYTYKVDKRDSIMRPTQGYVFNSATTLCGLSPDGWSARFLRQEFHMRWALPLGFQNAALNLGISGGLLLPWTKGLFSPLPNNCFMGGNPSTLGSLVGIDPLWGVRCRGVHSGTTDGLLDGNTSFMSSLLDGNFAFSTSADLSFDLPVKVLKDNGIFAHVSASAGSILKLKEMRSHNFSLKNCMESFRSSVKCGIIIPTTNQFRWEVNICYVLDRSISNEGKVGLQWCFS